MDNIFDLDLNDLLNSGGLTIGDYWYYKCLSENTIIINDEIDSSLITSAVIPLMRMDADPDINSIQIIINTAGGEVYSGFALVDTIERLKTKTAILIAGMAASMGTLIAMAGHNNPNVTTGCYEHSVGLIHSGNSYMEGATHTISDTLKFSEKYQKKIEDYIINHSKIDEDTYKDLYRQEFWMTSDDMLKYGIVDRIVDRTVSD